MLWSVELASLQFVSIYWAYTCSRHEAGRVLRILRKFPSREALDRTGKAVEHLPWDIRTSTDC